MNIAQCLAWAKQVLSEGESPSIDAKVLLCDVLKRDTTFLITYPEYQLSAEQFQRFQAMVARRVEGEPVAYIIGTQDFWTLTLKVNEHTLIPRPETELLVETVLSLVTSHPQNEQQHPLRILDLGTGTGAIALALASELPKAQVEAVDRIPEAVELAKENASNLAISNIKISQSDWFDNITDEPFHFIVTNPPYVEADSPWLVQGDVRFEPASALTSGDDGLDDIRYIIEQSKGRLLLSGWLLIEHGYTQSEAIQKLFQQAGYLNITAVEDYSGHPRICYAQKCVA
ncbi:peptide chain release factor N(5)-glutamine methyltransferase [Paraneptunicella aestuarii]|nr:peptide chain release factor N(5)-glutamine methyltransferase [Paraneptunicella aestuarii]